jgi:hypothetical protein
MDFKEMSNSEIEVIIKQLEFEYEKTNLDITKLGNKLNELSSDYNKAKFLLDKRLNPNKFK